MIRPILIFIFVSLILIGSGFTNPLEHFLFSGRLGTASSGTMVGTTVVSMTAKLYKLQSGGTASYIQVFPSIEINEGYFSLAIGPALPDLINHSWLELTVQGSTLSPRRQLPALPFAIQAANAQDSQTLQGASPTEIRNSLLSELGASVSTGQIELGVTTLEAQNIGAVNLAVQSGSVDFLQVSTLDANTLNAGVVDANRFIGDGSSLTNVWHTSDEISAPYIEAATFSDGSGVWTRGEISVDQIYAMTVTADFFMGDGSLLTGIGSGGFLQAGNSSVEIDTTTTNVPEHIQVTVDSVETLYISSTGLGVGVSFPSAALEVAGTVAADFFVGDGSNLTGILVSGENISAPEVFATTLSDGIAVLNSGNLYVGDVEATGTVTASAFVGNGSNLTGILVSGESISAPEVYATTLSDGIALLNSGNLYVGDVEATGTVTASAFVGDGSKLTGILVSGENISAPEFFGTTLSDGIAVLNSGNLYVGDVEASGTVTASAFVGDGSNLTGILVSGENISAPEVSGTTLSDGLAVLSGGNFYVGDVEATGTVTASAFVGDGTGLSGVLLSGANISASEISGTTLSDGLAVLSGGNFYVGDVEATGTVTASAFVGDGSGISGILLSGANISAPEISGTTLSDGLAVLSGGNFYVGDVEATGTVTASAFVGDGTGLSGILLSGANISASEISGTTLSDGLSVLSGGSLYVGDVEATGTVTASAFVGDASGLSNFPTPSAISSGSTTIEIDTTTQGTQEHIHVFVDSVERMFITSNGVGIGVTFPTDALVVNGTISADNISATTMSATDINATNLSGDGSAITNVLHPGDIISTPNTLTITADGQTAILIEHSSAESANTTKISLFDGGGFRVFEVDVEGDIYAGSLDVLDVAISGHLRNATSTLNGVNSGTHINLATLSQSGSPGASHSYISITGGQGNQALNDFASIGAGNQNTASGYSSRVGGGEQNIASGDWSYIGGGGINEAPGTLASVVGGQINTAGGYASFVGGGYGNVARGSYSAVGGGFNNLTTSSYSVIAGGEGNAITGDWSAIPGGSLLTIQSGDTFGFNGSGISQVVTSGMASSAIFMVSHFGVGTTSPSLDYLADFAGNVSIIGDLRVIGDLNVQQGSITDDNGQLGSSPFTDNTTHIVYSAGNMLLGTGEADEQLVVGGKMRLNTNNDDLGEDGTIRWTGSDLEVKNAGSWVSLTSGSSSSSSSSTDTDELRFFSEFQTIETSAASSWESFEVSGTSYLAVANLKDDNSNYEIQSRIYQWDGSSFSLFQSINTTGAQDFESFLIGADSYLAVAHKYDGSNYKTDSKIYKWNGSQFSEFQSIPTSGAYDWESFNIGADTYLALANSNDGSSKDIDSVIYKWDSVQSQFVITQTIATTRAWDWESFEISGETYLAVANNFNDTGNTYSTNSQIYKWNGSQFASFQTIATKGGADWESFVIGSDTYLAVANYYDGSSFSQDSKVYKWDGSQFVEFSSIPTLGAHDLEGFTIGEDFYLAIANHREASSDYTLDSTLHRWNGTGFETVQNFTTLAAFSWKQLTVDGEVFLAVANYYDETNFTVDSKIYKAELATSGGGSSSTDSNFALSGNDTYLTTGALGIGTSAPQEALDVQGRIVLSTNTDDAGIDGTLRWTGSDLELLKSGNWESLTDGGSTTTTDELRFFSEFQTIETSAASGWESFEISGTSYLAVANLKDDNSNLEIQSRIYQWDGSSFSLFQSINTSGAQDFESFMIGSDTYLAVANKSDGSNFEVDSKIYKWNGSQFSEFQSIPTSGAYHWESFSIGADTFLASANSDDGSSKDIDSVIYRWDSIQSQFVITQTIATTRAWDWESFEISGETYLAVANNYNDTGNTSSTNSQIYKWNGTQFASFQTIATTGAADWESFVIGSDTYLAVANYYDGSSYSQDSKIYKWDGSQFVEFSSIPTVGAKDLEGFTIGENFYLAIASNYDGVNHVLDSTLHRWNGTEFEAVQNLPTMGGHSWNQFTVDGQTFLAVANFTDGTNFTIDSKIYKAELETTSSGGGDNNFTLNGSDTVLDTGLLGLGTTTPQEQLHVNGRIQLDVNTDNAGTDGTLRWTGSDLEVLKSGNWESLTDGGSTTTTDELRFFSEFQTIATTGSVGFESFSIGSDSYLAGVNFEDGSSKVINSTIHKWDGTQFSEFQSIPSTGAFDWKSFDIDSDTYLALANHFDGSSYEIDSKIYKWNGSQFSEFQSIPTSAALDWESFVIDSDTYVAVANWKDSSSNIVDSKIYKWNGTQFSEFQSISTTGAHDWEYFTIGSDTYLALANNKNDSTYNVNSRIYKWNGTQFSEFQSISTKGARDWESFQIGSDSYLVVANSDDDSTTSLNSIVYQWDSSQSQFVEIQEILTDRAFDWDSFTIGDDTFITVATNSDTIDSRLFRWNGTAFLEIQTFSTKKGTRTVPFNIGSDTYLAVTNHKDGSDYEIDSIIYKAAVKTSGEGSSSSGDSNFALSGSDTYLTTGALGIGTSAPQEALDVQGRIVLSTNTDNAGSDGTIRWSGTDFEGNVSGDWKSLTSGGSSTGTTELRFFSEYQTIETSAAHGLDSFEISGTTYLAVAHLVDENINWEIQSKIYQWNGSTFSLFQSIDTTGAQDFESFVIGADTYLALANKYDGSNYEIDSKIFKWNGSQFSEFQSIPTSGAYDWESFTIGSDTYLALANSNDGSSKNIDSVIYKWDSVQSQFVITQTIATKRAHDWESFEISGETYLAVANNFDDTPNDYNTNSEIYKWNGSQFSSFQTIATTGGSDWKSFTIGSDFYLAVANYYDGTSYSQDSKVYKWDGSQFVEFSSIPTIGASDLEGFTVGEDFYLSIANHRESTSNRLLDSTLHRWNGTEFETVQNFPTKGAISWNQLTIDGETFLAVANYYDNSNYTIDSIIYKADLSTSGGSSAEDDNFSLNGSDTVLDSGFLGLGTTTPAVMLDVAGDSKVSGTIEAQYFRHSTPVMFRVHRTTDQSISSTNETTVDFTAEAFDLGSNFDLTSDSFTAPVSGVYWFSATARDTAGTDGNTFRVKFRVDGAVDMQHYCRWVSADGISCRVEGLINLNANQEVAFIVHHDDSGGISLKGNSGSTFFQGRLVEPTN
jgi:hypothetical protein